MEITQAMELASSYSSHDYYSWIGNEVTCVHSDNAIFLRILDPLNSQ